MLRSSRLGTGAAFAPLNLIPNLSLELFWLTNMLPPLIAELLKHLNVLAWLRPLSKGKPVITTLTNTGATVKGNAAP